MDISKKDFYDLLYKSKIKDLNNIKAKKYAKKYSEIYFENTQNLEVILNEINLTNMESIDFEEISKEIDRYIENYKGLRDDSDLIEKIDEALYNFDITASIEKFSNYKNQMKEMMNCEFIEIYQQMKENNIVQQNKEIPSLIH